MTQAQVNQTLAEIQAAAAALAEVDDDMNVVVAGGGGARRLPVGKTLARLVSYIEYGKQPQEFNGKAKDPAIEFRLGFALYSPGYANDDGTPYVLETFNISKSRNEKAGAFLLFKQMNWAGDAKNFAQLLTRAFILDIQDYTPKNAAPGAEPRSRINLKLVLPPKDPLSGVEYPCPPAREEDLHLFSWVQPTLSGWDKLYIEGTNDKGESKNWIQETIVAATDFAGSPLQSLLMQHNRPIPKARVPKSRAATAGAATPVGVLPAAAAPVGVVPQAVAPTPAAPVAAAAVAPVVAPAVAAAPLPWEAAPVVAAPVAVAPAVGILPA